MVSASIEGRVKMKGIVVTRSIENGECENDAKIVINWGCAV